MPSRRFRIRYLLLPVICLGLLGYIAHHTLNGARGLMAYRQMQTRAATLKTRIAKLRQERRKLETRVALLHRESLDRDMLDERARVILNLAKPDEITILREHR